MIVHGPGVAAATRGGGAVMAVTSAMHLASGAGGSSIGDYFSFLGAILGALAVLCAPLVGRRRRSGEISAATIFRQYQQALLRLERLEDELGEMREVADVTLDLNRRLHDQVISLGEVPVE